MIDPITEDIHHERSDHNRLLKRVAKATREGNNSDLNYKRFDEAMRSPVTGLTHVALVGTRKQYVPDAEKLLSFHVAKFFKDNNYLYQKLSMLRQLLSGISKHLMDVVSINSRDTGLSNANCILDELRPWHQDNYDLSTLDINR